MLKQYFILASKQNQATHLWKSVSVLESFHHRFNKRFRKLERFKLIFHVDKASVVFIVYICRVNIQIKRKHIMTLWRNNLSNKANAIFVKHTHLTFIQVQFSLFEV